MNKFSLIAASVIRKLSNFAFAEDGSIKAKVLRSGIWVGASKVFLTLLSLVRSVVLARLLSPDAFGLMGLAGIAIRAIETFTRPGISQALIQRQDDFDKASDTAFTLLLLRGFLLALLVAALAPFISSYYENETLESMLEVLAIVFIIDGLTNINTINKMKELNFRRISYIEQLTEFLSTIIVIFAAYILRSVWALVIGQLVSSSLKALLSYYLIEGKPRIRFNWKIAKELLSYGKFITASSIVIFVATEIDTAVIGKIMGTEKLGYYVLAFTFADLATSSISKLISSIMLPAYSKLQADKAALKKAYLTTLKFVCLITLPVMVGVVLTADLIINTVFGEKWYLSVTPLQILIVFGFIRSLTSINGYLFEGIGKPKIAFKISLLRLAILVPLIVPITKAYGLDGVAVLITIGIAVQWIISIFVLRKHIFTSIKDIALAIYPAFWRSVLMGALVVFATQYFDEIHLLNMIIVVSIGVVSYGILSAQLLLKISNIKQ
ncbi:MAG: lipopolysaccharide biosynthesis protein [Candidatus Thiodiazotropha taylori]|nr:lipopolysaccharide biosynthesis protein [Candidatus Thiodiazotropha taylori]MCW4290914.1 lipopolysaccharide biosynthesis protein [Candidatus Thiodiazotropha taylori]